MLQDFQMHHVHPDHARGEVGGSPVGSFPLAHKGHALVAALAPVPLLRLPHTARVGRRHLATALQDDFATVGPHHTAMLRRPAYSHPLEAG